MTGILIAGPSRCGKSTLSSVISSAANLSVLTVEVLLPASRRLQQPKTNESKRQFLQAYMNRPRYMDPAKSLTRTPANDIEYPVDALIETAVSQCGNSTTELITKSLDAWAEVSGTSAWLGPDLHAETIFDKLIAENPSLKLVVLLRDPRSAIAASLYWRTYPARTAHPLKMIVYTSLLWCLSAHLGKKWQGNYPNSSRTLFVEDLEEITQGGTIDLFGQYKLSEPKGLSPRSMYFCFDGNKSWLCPDETLNELLTPDEVGIIEKLCGPWFGRINPNRKLTIKSWIVVFAARSFLNFVLFVSWYNPSLAKDVLDKGMSPLSQARRALYAIARKLLRRS